MVMLNYSLSNGRLVPSRYTIGIARTDYSSGSLRVPAEIYSEEHQDDLRLTSFWRDYEVEAGKRGSIVNTNVPAGGTTRGQEVGSKPSVLRV